MDGVDCYRCMAAEERSSDGNLTLYKSVSSWSSFHTLFLKNGRNERAEGHGRVDSTSSYSGGPGLSYLVLSLFS